MLFDLSCSPFPQGISTDKKMISTDSKNSLPISPSLWI